jgi:predicted nucleic acid-binding protein
VERFLRERFPEPLLPLPPVAHRALLGLAVRAGLAGGAIYDALVAATAKRASASLLTRDRRAAPTYEAVGVRYELLS